MGINVINISSKSGRKNNVAKKENSINYLTSAKIVGLESSPTWDSSRKCYIFGITLVNKSSEFKDVLPFIVGINSFEAEEVAHVIRKRFSMVQIFDYSEVAVIYSQRGIVKAIRSKYSRNSGWVDMIHNRVATLKELNIPIRSLIVN